MSRGFNTKNVGNCKLWENTKAGFLHCSLYNPHGFKSASKPNKYSLIHTSQGKTMILPRANNGIK